VILHDNLRSAVLERRGDQVHFHPRALAHCGQPIRKAAWNVLFATCANHFGPAVLSSPCRSAIVRLSSGVTKWHISAPGPGITRAASPIGDIES
jgi:hypothetical protein